MFMIQAGVISDQINDSNIIRIQQHGLGLGSFNNSQPLLGEIQHLLAIPKIHGTQH